MAANKIKKSKTIHKELLSRYLLQINLKFTNTLGGQGSGSGLWRQENPQQLRVAELGYSVSATSI